jgi:hypothetical protein
MVKRPDNARVQRYFDKHAADYDQEMGFFERHLPGDHRHPLRLQPSRKTPAGRAVPAQTAATLVLIFGASQLFVKQLEWAGPALGLPAVVVALLLSPVATELPEVMNAIIWVRQGKTQLALANISGAMMIQATFPSAIGIAFTPWHFDTPLLLAGGATLAQRQVPTRSDAHRPGHRRPARRRRLLRLRDRAGHRPNLTPRSPGPAAAARPVRTRGRTTGPRRDDGRHPYDPLPQRRARTGRLRQTAAGSTRSTRKRPGGRSSRPCAQRPRGKCWRRTLDRLDDRARNDSAACRLGPRTN